MVRWALLSFVNMDGWHIALVVVLWVAKFEDKVLD
jgi:hypothetical protein